MYPGGKTITGTVSQQPAFRLVSVVHYGKAAGLWGTALSVYGETAVGQKTEMFHSACQYKISLSTYSYNILNGITVTVGTGGYLGMQSGKGFYGYKQSLYGRVNSSSVISIRKKKSKF